MMNDERYLVPREYAERLGVDLKKVLRWIRAGELMAIDVSAKRGGQPRWRIPASSVKAFEEGRASKPPAPKPSRRRRPERDPGWVEYY